MYLPILNEYCSGGTVKRLKIEKAANSELKQIPASSLICAPGYNQPYSSKNDVEKKLMKLFSTYNRLNLISTVLIFVLASVAYYFLLRFVIINQLDENLDIEQEEIETYVAKYKKLPEIIPVKDQAIRFTQADGYRRKLFHTMVGYDAVEKDTAAFRELFFSIKTSENIWYQVSVAKSMEGTENLIQSIIIITICTILLILLTSLVINRLVLNRLWQPFYNTLQLLREFKIGNKDSVVLPASKIEEFSLMNGILQHAMNRADQDYLLLREFTENASHEMQTPLAIIRSKLDLIIQEENFSYENGENLQALYKAIEKLSRLNKSLLLLTKIENNQFADISEINLLDKIEEKLVQFNEIITENKITVFRQLREKKVLMNADLVDILLNNLLSNSIKHNLEGGSIYIELTITGQLSISNTSPVKVLNNEKLFTRFYKEANDPEHTGLGLSILKQICIVSKCSIKYDFIDGIHCFTIEWD